MNDKELLEMAAKAAGIKIDKTKHNGGGMYNTGFNILGDAVLDWHNNITWNPLRQNADAFRLLVQLGIGVDFNFANTVGEVSAAQTLQEYQYEPLDNDQCAATRRAIVRAAAEIGRMMP